MLKAVAKRKKKMLEEVLEFLIAMPERQVVLENGQAGTCIHLSDHTITMPLAA
ncbi:hypothetical protein ACRRTK_014807 [Alexandromys fortis]